MSLLAPLTEPAHSGCLNCPGKPIRLPMATRLSVGFGRVTVTRGDVVIWCGDSPRLRARDVERLAATALDYLDDSVKRPRDGDPGWEDWRIVFDAPLYEAEYQRQGRSRWMLVRRGMGFA